jgi:hypothetical protein|tara:strand:- start:2151 stop:4037 length:1887 start_codon:yes stop_codon:yes gene_type:complete
MSSKTPVRVVFDGSNNATGLAEFQSGEFVPLSAGGIGASLSIGSAGQVLKVNSGASALEFGNVEAILNIDGLTDGSGITIADGDDFALSDAGTEKKVNASQISTYVQGTISGDITISGGTAAIGSGVIVNADINSSAAIADSKLDTISTAGKVSLSALEIDGGTDIGAALTTSDLIVVDDGAGGTNRKAALSRLVTLMESEIDAIGGNLTITGNLTVNGSTTTVSTTNTVVSDKLFELANGQSGTPSGDIGLVMERGSSDNAFIGFDESADKFIVGTGSFTGATTGDLTITTGTLVANIEGNVTGNVTGNASGTAATVTGAAQSNITSLGTLTTLTVDNIIINGTTIGHTDDTDLITLADGIATVAGEISVTTLDIGGTNVSSTAAELNLVDGSSAGTIVNSKAVIYGSSGEVNATTLQIAGSSITSTAAELNLVDGGTSAGTTAVAGGDGIVTNDGGTMRQTTVDTFDTYLSQTTKTLTNKTLTSPQINTQVDFLARAEARFQDASGGQYVALEAPATVSSSVTFTLPAADGTSGQVIETDGSGALSFTDVATSGFTNSTITDTPGSSANFDLAKGNNTGSAETPFETGGNDAFGVSVGFVFDAMEPIGSSTDNNTDLGSSESHVGA